MSETMRECGAGPMGTPWAWDIEAYAMDGYTEKLLVVAPTPERAIAKAREIYAEDNRRGPGIIISVEKADYRYVSIG